MPDYGTICTIEYCYLSYSYLGGMRRSRTSANNTHGRTAAESKTRTRRRRTRSAAPARSHPGRCASARNRVAKCAVAQSAAASRAPAAANLASEIIQARSSSRKPARTANKSTSNRLTQAPMAVASARPICASPHQRDLQRHVDGNPGQRRLYRRRGVVTGIEGRHRAADVTNGMRPIA